MNNACLPREKARAAGAFANRENASSYSCLKFLVNRYDFFDLWDFFFEKAFNSHLESHSCARAAGACALKADLYRFAVFGGDEFDVTAVTLQIRPDGFDYRFNLHLEGILCFIVIATALFAHIGLQIFIKGRASL
jgi:hypothetical protein